MVGEPKSDSAPPPKSPGDPRSATPRTLGVGTGFYDIARHMCAELRRACVYKPVRARVARYTPARKTGDEEDSLPARIEYGYLVEGSAYQGKQTGSGGLRARDEYSAALERAFSPGDEVTAYYDPLDPGRSTLNPAARPSFVGFLIFMSPFLAVGAGMIWAGVFGDPLRFRIGGPRGVRLGGRRTGGIRVSGGGAYLNAYFIISALTAFAFFIATFLLYWKTAFVVGFALWLVGVPALTLVSVRVWRRVARRKSPAPAPAPAPEGRPVAEVAAIRPGRKLAGRVVATLLWCGITAGLAAFVIWAIVSNRARSRPAGPDLADRITGPLPIDQPAGLRLENLQKYLPLRWDEQRKAWASAEKP